MSTTCDFCGRQGHIEAQCYTKKRARDQAQDNVRKGRSGFAKPKPKEQAQAKEVTMAQSAQIVSAGNACVVSSLSASTSRQRSDWNTDTGASLHMTPHRSWFFRYATHIIPVRLADGSIIHSAGIGSVQFQPMADGVPGRLVEFVDVLHVPLTIEGSTMCFILNNHPLFTASVTDRNIGYLDGHVVPRPVHTANAISTCPVDATLWHRRCAHLDVDSVRKLISDKLATGITFHSSSPHLLCEPCINGKLHRHNIPRIRTSRRARPFELVVSDLKGPLAPTREGYIYWATFIDDATRFWVAIPLKHKSDTFTAFKRYVAWAETRFPGHKLTLLRDDSGGEYSSTEMAAFCADRGIGRHHTETDEPYQNGIAERGHRTLAEGITSMLSEAKLPASMWNEALRTFVHVHNRTLTSSVPGMTPYQALKKRIPNISYFRVFGCLAYVLDKKHRALHSHAIKMIFVGYGDGVKAWRFWDPVARRFLVSSHAVFDERIFPGNTRSISIFGDPSPPVSPDASDQGGNDDNDDLPPPEPSPSPPTPDPSVHSPPHSPPSPLPSPVSSEPRRSGRSTRHQGSLNLNTLQKQNVQPPDSRLFLAPQMPLPADPSSASTQDNSGTSLDDDDNDHQVLSALSDDAVAHGVSCVYQHDLEDSLSFSEAMEYAYSTSTHDGEPRTLREALALGGEQAKKWYSAAVEEVQALVENGTFQLVRLPPDRTALGSRWVFKVKHKSDGSIERHKARLVVQGFSQRPGFDYTETFAPTPRWSALRAVLALAAIEDLELESIDISSAFLNGDLEEEIYVRQPEGFTEKGPEWVWRLLKSLYGLKQAGRCWHKKLNEVLEALGFHRIKCEHSIWVYQRDDVRIIIPVFIDDMTIASKSQAAIQKVKDDLRAHFKFRDLGPTSWLLGVEITRDRSTRTLSLSQRQYTLDLLERFGMSQCDTVATPLNPGTRLTSAMSPKTQEESAEMHDKPYRAAVGALQYLATATRCDIAHSVGVLARFGHNPGIEHWKALKHLLRYLKGTLDYKLTYHPDPSGSHLFTAFCDADHGGDLDNGRSTSGFMIRMGTAAISWASRLQTIVALSTTEAEYVSAVAAGQEILFLRNLFTCFGYSLNSPTPLSIDNQSALSVTKNPEHHGRMKHLDLRFYWLRDEVAKGHISVSYLSTHDMPADLLTKSLSLLTVHARPQSTLGPSLSEGATLIGYGPCCLIKPENLTRSSLLLNSRPKGITHPSRHCFSPIIMAEYSSRLPFAKLGDTPGTNNYLAWSENMRARLKTKGVYGVVTGDDAQPSPGDADLRRWRKDRDTAAGEIWLMLDDSVKTHVRAKQDDPVEMWKVLETTFVQKRAGTRFNALDQLFSLRILDSESLTNFATRVSSAVQNVQSLRPTKYGLDELDDELASMALIRGLPSELYGSFTSSLLLLPQIDRATILEAFIAEDNNRRLRPSDDATLASRASAAAAASMSTTCDFCGRQGHIEAQCYTKQRARDQAQDNVRKGRSGFAKPKPKEQAQAKEVTTAQSAQIVSAGNACVVSSLSASTSRQCSDWNTDTGASLHMTPHRSWFFRYATHIIPVRLADGSIIHSAGIGSVQFQPMADGVPGCLVEFVDVLHVPRLDSNLLSVFHLTRVKGYKVTIEGSTMCFILNNHPLFTASVTDRNIGYLDGHVVPRPVHTANAISTCPVDATLWHRRCAHLDVDSVRKLVSDKLATGITFHSSSPHLLCEPCINGKLHRHNIPHIRTSRRARPFELVVSDLKGPLAPTHEGYIYWATFIDDATRFWVAIPLKHKSDTFTAFKRYVAWAETRFPGHKLTLLRDDSGGEYSSTEMAAFCADRGIGRHHTETDEPYQNGIAERGHRTLAEGITSMLSEAKLPASMWNEALNVLRGPERS
ncbi:hypothetical protein EVG20_g1549 [Dentipellis fragilis]|uniref:Integrase catalytic domain-containing protein n=1 Tax=Dentipellis fragilis TaxID=205917 RepID=A0A4Y9ZBF0_9AGAM|nr:hypothetical protein EVG20_g1549 [Dentipellis fragilis]